jgi:hypothetical protein
MSNRIISKMGPIVYFELWFEEHGQYQNVPCDWIRDFSTLSSIWVVIWDLYIEFLFFLQFLD